MELVKASSDRSQQKLGRDTCKHASDVSGNPSAGASHDSNRNMAYRQIGGIHKVCSGTSSGGGFADLELSRRSNRMYAGYQYKPTTCRPLDPLRTSSPYGHRAHVYATIQHHHAGRSITIHDTHAVTWKSDASRATTEEQIMDAYVDRRTMLCGRLCAVVNDVNIAGRGASRAYMIHYVFNSSSGKHGACGLCYS